MTLPVGEPEEAPLRDPNQPNLIDTHTGKTDGLNKCARCGSTDVVYDQRTGELVCTSCRNRWTEDRVVEKYGLNTDLTELSGLHLGSGAGAVDAQASTVVTLKCQGCGAEVVIDTATNLSARCHWCRQTLSLNSQVQNGAVPDALLPFTLTHEEAVERIRAFSKKREFFASKQFRAEFKPENVVGVFLPYMVIDGNLTAELSGKGEHQTRRYTRGSGKNQKTYYDADVYEVGRRFDFTVDDLIVEASAEKADMDTRVNSHNVINTILPFDTENALTYNSSFLGSYTAEKRDLDVKSMTPRVMDQLLSVARSEASNTLGFYDRGVRWEQEHVEVVGSRWLALLLPVWLYSYQDEEGFLHYIAVNGRTGETMGSVPLNKPKLLFVSTAIGLLATVLAGVLVFAPGDDGSTAYSSDSSYSYTTDTYGGVQP